VAVQSGLIDEVKNSEVKICIEDRVCIRDRCGFMNGVLQHGRLLLINKRREEEHHGVAWKVESRKERK